MIYNCFPFFNELDLLEIRLHELWDVVDYFVVCEATRTHSGKPKPLYFYGERDHRFRAFSKKLISVVVQDMPITSVELEAVRKQTDEPWVSPTWAVGEHWIRERYQRDFMAKLLDCRLGPDDIIILEDADEMVRPEVVDNLDTMLLDGIWTVDQAMYAYYLNLRYLNWPWAGTKIFRKRFMKWSLSEIRFHTPHVVKTVKDGGWHFTFMGGVGTIRAKIQAYAHQDFNIPNVIENLGKRVREHKDVLGSDAQFVVVPIDNSFPQYVLNNLDKYDQMGWIC